MSLNGYMFRDDTGPIWKAMADPTRRAVLDVLRKSPRTTGQICEKFPKLSRTAVMKHLKVLHRAGLIAVKREGRLRWNYLNAVPLQKIYERWVKPYEAFWAEKALGLKEHIERKKG